MTTWRGATCAVGYCEDQASDSIHVLPLCHKHGMDVAANLSGSIIAKYELEQRKKAEQRTEQTEAAAGNREGGSVYYAQIGDYIKIGYSARLRNRLRSLRIDELLAVEPGDPALERVRHRQFSADRIDMRRENFRASAGLNAHIALVRSKHGLPTWAVLPRTSKITTRHQEPK